MRIDPAMNGNGNVLPACAGRRSWSHDYEAERPAIDILADARAAVRQEIRERFDASDIPASFSFSFNPMGLR
jgi:hypothetical protein